GKTEKAEKQFQKIIQKNPFSLDALTGLGYVSLKLKKTDKAKKYFQDALKTNPYYPDAKRGMQSIKGKK
ncbi:MAG: tetratricopeptide repeat protein, partial [Nitrospinota bacterium]|nr:tetratricopeptide repeat protein [Nitrospinota bacterium]